MSQRGPGELAQGRQRAPRQGPPTLVGAALGPGAAAAPGHLARSHHRLHHHGLWRWTTDLVMLDLSSWKTKNKVVNIQVHFTTCFSKHQPTIPKRQFFKLTYFVVLVIVSPSTVITWYRNISPGPRQALHLREGLRAGRTHRDHRQRGQLESEVGLWEEGREVHRSSWASSWRVGEKFASYK